MPDIWKLESLSGDLALAVLPGNVATEADPMMRGRVAGAVKVADQPLPVMIEPL